MSIRQLCASFCSLDWVWSKAQNSSMQRCSPTKSESWWTITISPWARLHSEYCRQDRSVCEVHSTIANMPIALEFMHFHFIWLWRRNDVSGNCRLRYWTPSDCEGGTWHISGQMVKSSSSGWCDSAASIHKLIDPVNRCSCHLLTWKEHIFAFENCLHFSRIYDECSYSSEIMRWMALWWVQRKITVVWCCEICLELFRG